MEEGPTVNLVSGNLVACYDDTCDIYREGYWQNLQHMTVQRRYHSSATTEDAVLLIGGVPDWDEQEGTTEWIPVDGSPARPGPFTVRHGSRHCTIQLSDGNIVVTGGLGSGSEAYVTKYHLVHGTETPLSSLKQPRYAHACGAYQDADDQQVSKRREKTNTNTQIHQDKRFCGAKWFTRDGKRQIQRHKYRDTNRPRLMVYQDQTTNKLQLLCRLFL